MNKKVTIVNIYLMSFIKGKNTRIQKYCGQQYAQISIFLFKYLRIPYSSLLLNLCLYYKKVIFFCIFQNFFPSEMEIPILLCSVLSSLSLFLALKNSQVIEFLWMSIVIWAAISKVVQLILYQHGFVLCGSSYIWMFFSYSTGKFLEICDSLRKLQKNCIA